MKFPKPYALKSIADILDCSYVGEDDYQVYGANEIHVVEKGDIVFVDHPKYYDKALNSAASVILINKEVACPDGKALLISKDPFTDFNKLTSFFKPFKPSTQSISSSATIDNTAVIQPNVFIGNNVKIGKNCIIHSNVSIYDDSEIGNNVIIHSGSVIGADAFYYKNRPEAYDKLKSGGNVVIENDVEIGALSTIDKGVSGSTLIKKGTKIDNLVQIGHDTVIGEKVLIAAHTGIAGCCIIEKNVTIWGQVGISSGLSIGESAIILAQSGVSKNLAAHKTYFGTPASDIKKKYREMAHIANLPNLAKQLKDVTRIK
ncbi:UDP-3-O-(3-hydroxymyristoyl)glucosamine N-acyltransferase [Psychroflexus sp. ALD_RP9]|uniref:UDP-3-O-(3-hydroxymyristoyl)glucosamine N-acyltransferase n=1 Tax=Psychroflexus sp. ALD_RP9 TaxID=2777186 RepID=UPI001A8DFFDB|nr:UDP-3-O-(3-hydroxymyristoyl)glucosamine N-acyltransferase [Psychroflexus sp. ALD_RP9]QSS97090.1 UDP-3-O-(3-hydroxymyristoyl)glucosamine N-acyltransferase [Psychroflexus sp. ALD_RP9]